MDLESLAAHEGFGFFKAAIRSTYGKGKRRRLIAEAIRELLALEPDIDAAEARLRAAKALGLTTDDLELRAERLLANARRPQPQSSEGRGRRKTGQSGSIPVPRKSR